MYDCIVFFTHYNKMYSYETSLQVEFAVEESFKNGTIGPEWLISFFDSKLPGNKLHVYILRHSENCSSVEENPPYDKDLDEYIGHLLEEYDMKQHSIVKFVTSKEHFRICCSGEVGTPMGSWFVDGGKVYFD